jgi:hypothetical protein
MDLITTQQMWSLVGNNEPILIARYGHWGLTGSETKNDCGSQDQQQITVVALTTAVF